MPDFDEKTADTLVRLKPSKYLRVNGQLYSGQLVAEKANGKIINKWVSPEFTLPLAIAKELADGNDPAVVILGAATIAKKEVIEAPKVRETPNITKPIEPTITETVKTAEVAETKEITEIVEKTETTEKVAEKPSRGRPKKTE